ncbi:MAG: hypothetical protein IPK10_18660 [Bacteroidetes bacterium]|nr:hypothetical protein [Bacteroidota bacterium]
MRKEDINDLVKYRQLEELYQEPLIKRFLHAKRKIICMLISNESMDNEINFFSLMLHSTELSIIMDKSIFSLFPQFAFKEDEWILPLHHHFVAIHPTSICNFGEPRKELSNEKLVGIIYRRIGSSSNSFSVADGIPVMDFWRRES